MQRHLRKHGIEAYTIGIDDAEFDAEVDEFIHADMRDVELPSVADVVICYHMLSLFKSKPRQFKKAVENCADWLKPDGLFFIDLDTRQPRPAAGTINRGFLHAMSKDETGAHAAQCHHMIGELCPHGWEANTLRGRVMRNC